MKQNKKIALMKSLVYIEHALDEDPRERVLLGKNGFAELML